MIAAAIAYADFSYADALLLPLIRLRHDAYAAAIAAMLIRRLLPLTIRESERAILMLL